MPGEHELRIALATALRDRDEARALAEKWARIEGATAERGIRADADALSEIQGLQAALANANAEKAHVSALRAKQDAELVSTREALAAARRETALYRGVIDNLLSAMEMQEKRESGEFHITGEVMWGIWSDAKSQARAALAAPAAGEEGRACRHFVAEGTGTNPHRCYTCGMSEAAHIGMGNR